MTDIARVPERVADLYAPHAYDVTKESRALVRALGNMHIDHQVGFDPQRSTRADGRCWWATCRLIVGGLPPKRVTVDALYRSPNEALEALAVKVTPIRTPGQLARIAASNGIPITHSAKR